MAKFNYRDYMKNNPLLNEAQGYNDELDDSLGMKHGKKKQTMKQRRADSENMEKAKGKRKYSGDKSKDKVKESYDKVDEEMDKDMKKEEMDPKKKKITVKEFKSQIRERILAEMNEEEEDGMREEEDTMREEDKVDEGLFDFLKKKKKEAPKSKDKDNNEPIGVDYDGNYIYANEGMTEAEEVDVKDDVNIDVDVEDDIDIDDVSDKSEIEVDSELAGESSDVSAILGLLTKAQEKAANMGDEKLLDQIGNTITYYTRAHVVK